MRGWLAEVGAEFYRVLFRIRSIRTPLSLFLLPHPSGIRACGALLCSCSFRVFPTHPLHVPSRIDRGELPSVAVERPGAPPSSTGMPNGRGSLAV